MIEFSEFVFKLKDTKCIVDCNENACNCESSSFDSVPR